MPVAVILNWLWVLSSVPPPATSLLMAWSRTGSRLQAAGWKWQAINGPMSAAQKVLREAGWEPLLPN
eukprot:10048817-Lingulodinium_polyedra.AAC.1